MVRATTVQSQEKVRFLQPASAEDRTTKQNKSPRKVSMIGTASFGEEWWDVYGISDKILSTVIIDLSGGERPYVSSERGVMLRVTVEVLDERLKMVKALRKRGLK